MSGWTVPFSSSPQAPSTPGSDNNRKIKLPASPNGFFKSSHASHPSTTPAGPPPSSARSFTPADPPPSSIFGSSQLGSGKTLFGSNQLGDATPASRRGASLLPAGPTDGNKLPRPLDRTNDLNSRSSNGFSTKSTFGVPKGSHVLDSESGSEEDPDAEGVEDTEEYEEYEEEEDEVSVSQDESTMDLYTEGLDRSLLAGSRDPSIPTGISAMGKSVAFGSSIMNESPHGIKRSRGGASIMGLPNSSIRKSSKQKQESAIPSIAKSMAAQRDTAELEEDDDFIVRTEDILEQDLYSTEVLGEAHDRALHAGLPKASDRLARLWRSSCDHHTASMAPKQNTVLGIGPDDSEPSMHKATYLGALLLQLHHPPTAKGKQALAVARLGRSSINTRSAQNEQIPANPTAIPKILVEWLDKCHNPYETFNIEVLKFDPNPTAHINYWDMLFSLVLRGKLSDVIQLLRKSNFRYARTAGEDRKDNEGYSNGQVKNIERVINKAIQVLEYCPAVQDDDWNVTGNAWVMFRKQIEHEMGELATFAEGRDRDLDPETSSFEASSFGLRGATMDLSKSARKAESRVPWTVYQNLKAIYGVLLGGTTEVLAMANDWVEATIGLTIWWTGDEDEDMPVGSVALTRKSLRQTHGTRLVEVNPIPAYLRRLAFAFGSINDEDSDEVAFSVNTLRPIEAGLASVFEGNVEGVLGLLRTWSLPVCSAVVEIASAGGWFQSAMASNLMDGLDESDLMVMSRHEHQTQPMSRDSILATYGDALSTRDEVHDIRTGTMREGWELAMSVLARLDDEGMAARKVSELLDQLALDSNARMNKILQTCEQFGIPEQARKITEEYADQILETSEEYGTALIYYARAHRRKKVKDILDLLISYSLVQSAAFPALSALDEDLHSLIFTPERSLKQLAQIDSKATEVLHTNLTGYASLRRFYDLRDEAVVQEGGQTSNLGTRARKAAAATALVAVINSAADNIHGGLFDGGRDTVIQVDGLLVLLGEAMMFVNQPKMLLPLPQCYALLKAIEDLQSVTKRVYAQCEECLHSAVAAHRKGASLPSPRRLLKSSTSNLTSAGSFSMVGSSMLQSESSGMGDSNKALVKSGDEVKRGWDWRAGLKEDVRGEDVLRILRLGLAKDIAQHWMSEGV